MCSELGRERERELAMNVQCTYIHCIILGGTSCVIVKIVYECCYNDHSFVFKQITIFIIIVNIQEFIFSMCREREIACEL